MTDVRFYPIPELNAVRDQFAYSLIFSAMDMKSGFLNIPVDDGSAVYFGLVTQDGLYVWRRMAFGLVNAPMHF